jgi:hypothetical protein
VKEILRAGKAKQIGQQLRIHVSIAKKEQVDFVYFTKKL